MAACPTWPGEQGDQHDEQDGHRRAGQHQADPPNAALRAYHDLVRDLESGIAIHESRWTSILRAAGKTLLDLHADAERARRQRR